MAIDMWIGIKPAGSMPQLARIEMANEMTKSWTEADVQALIGQSESIRREFKAGIMFDRDPEKTWVATLSKAVSALANTEGGELILGVDEDKKSKPKVAKIIDGVPKTLAPERLQDLIQGNVSPYLPGIHIERVKLSTLAERVVFVIQIPQGSTAYQANDRVYYGRSEFRTDGLPDHEIRLRMNRGRVARATVSLRLRRILLGSEHDASHEAALRTEYGAEIEAFKSNAQDAVVRFPQLLDLLVARYQRHPDEIHFSIVLQNAGELTIRDPALELRDVPSARLLGDWNVQHGSLTSRREMPGEVIYPGDEREIANSECELRCKRHSILAPGDFVLQWKVYLDNAPPSVGEIDLATQIYPELAKRRGEGD